MPNRIIREGILTSRRVNRLSAEEEVFLRRLLNVVDDFGRYAGDPQLLRAACYPLRLDAVRENEIRAFLVGLEKTDLIVRYEVKGEPFLEVADFRQQVRAKRSKFPSPSDAKQMPSTRAADAMQLHTQTETKTETKTETETRAEEEAAVAPTDRSSSTRARFTPPTVEEVREYLSEIGATFTAERFIDHHEETGWRRGKPPGYPVEDWKRVARTWKARDEERRAPGTPRHQTARIGTHPAPPGPRKAPEPPRSLPPPPPDGGVWPSVLQALRYAVDERDFDTWLKGTRQSGEVNGVLRVVVPSDFLLGHLPREYGEQVRAAASAVGVSVPIEYVVGEQELPA